MTSKPRKTPEEKTLMQVLLSIGVSKIDVPKLSEVTGIPVPIVIEALQELLSRDLVGTGSDALTQWYFLTEKGYKLVERK